MKRTWGVVAVLGLNAAWVTTNPGSERESHQAVVERSRAQVPTPPWPAGDERGMANTQGRGTWLRCAWHCTMILPLRLKGAATSQVRPVAIGAPDVR